METTENRSSPVSEPARPARRVGTFTMGVTLIAAGLSMLAAMLFPRLDMTWAIRLSPVLLVSLGVETLLSARKGSRIRYDWVGMLLCCIIVCVALCLFSIGWYVVHYPDRVLYF